MRYPLLHTYIHKLTLFLLFPLILFASAFFSLCLINVPAYALTVTYDAASDFSATNNPNGAWSYGWSSSLTSTLNLYPHGSHGWVWADPAWTGIGVWDDPDYISSGLPAVYYNGTGAIHIAGSVTMQPGQLAFHPGLSGEYSHVLWTTPTAGTFDIAVAFTGIDLVGTTTDVHVLHNGTSLFDGAVNGYGSIASFSTSVTVGMNDIIDFAVGYGNNGYIGDSTAITATVGTVVPEPATIALLGTGLLGMFGYWRRRFRK